MALKSKLLGWIEYSSEDEGKALISQIDNCMGFPTPDGKTKTWAKPCCMSNGFYPTATTQSWFVIVKEEIVGCLTQEQKDSIKTYLPEDWYDCGMTPPPSGLTYNELTGYWEG